MDQRTVAQYQIGERIGAGGMGEVYKARDTRLNRFVAVKVLSGGMSADEDRRRRFIQEAQAVSALNHPNIITIHDIVDDGGTQYMVVEYLDGKTLSELIPTGGLPVATVIRYARQIAEALCAAHAAGIIHRDLKPSNVMVTANDRVKVLDFGLAKLIDWTPGEPDAATVTLIPAPMTIEGTLLGTVNYMSPEQAEGKRIDARSDIFSFGAVVYEMLTGQAAFRGESVVATLTAVLRDEVRPIRDLAPEVPEELARIVTGCLKKDPAERAQSMEEVKTALVVLKRQADSGAINKPSTASAVVPPPARRRGPGTLVAVAAGLLVAIAVGGFWWATRPHPAPPVPHVQTPPVAAAPSQPGVLTNDSIVEMAGAHVTPSLMISQIRASKTDFNLSTAEVIRLAKAGVPEEVIEVMRNPQATADGPVPVAPLVASGVQPVAGVSVTLRDGLPLHLILGADIPATAVEGDSVAFQVAEDVRVGNSVVIRKGAPAIGFVVDAARKKALVLSGKMTLRLDSVDAVDGQKVPIRATLPVHPGIVSKRPVDAGVKKPGVASAGGTVYPGYVDGTKTVVVKR